jgi:hypothetical protein
MRKSITDLKVTLTGAEKLSVNQLCQLKGGGEDIRRSTTPPPAP